MGPHELHTGPHDLHTRARCAGTEWFSRPTAMPKSPSDERADHRRPGPDRVDQRVDQRVDGRAHEHGAHQHRAHQHRAHEHRAPGTARALGHRGTRRGTRRWTRNGRRRTGKSRRTRPIPFVLAGIAGLAMRPTTDPDLWWHLATGRWILDERRIPFTDPFSGPCPDGAGSPTSG